MNDTNQNSNFKITNFTLLAVIRPIDYLLKLELYSFFVILSFLLLISVTIFFLYLALKLDE